VLAPPQQCTLYCNPRRVHFPACGSPVLALPWRSAVHRNTAAIAEESGLGHPPGSARSRGEMAWSALRVRW